jgi:hypothetical protein
LARQPLQFISLKSNLQTIFGEARVRIGDKWGAARHETVATSPFLCRIELTIRKEIQCIMRLSTCRALLAARPLNKAVGRVFLPHGPLFPAEATGMVAAIVMSGVTVLAAVFAVAKWIDTRPASRDHGSDALKQSARRPTQF